MIEKKHCVCTKKLKCFLPKVSTVSNQTKYAVPSRDYRQLRRTMGLSASPILWEDDGRGSSRHNDGGHYGGGRMDSA